jgi:hypothetical protein
MFFRNVGRLPTDNTALYTTRQNSLLHQCLNEGAEENNYELIIHDGHSLGSNLGTQEHEVKYQLYEGPCHSSSG